MTEPALRQRIIDECLLAYLHDEALAWQMQAGEVTDGPADGNYQRPIAPIDSPRNVQQALMLRYRNIDVPPPASTQP